MYYYKRFRDMREDSDIKQEEVAAYLGIAQTQYSRYERGERELPLHHAVALARYYNVSLDCLTGISDQPRKLH